MDLKLIEYILKIADEGGISRAAEKLFITQSALNQQLLKLEGELGLQLFHRCKNDFHPTAAGEIYIRYGREMLQKKKEAYNILHDMANDRLGRLSVALTPERGIDMFTAIYPEFHDRFPRIIVEPQEMRVHDQLTQIVRGYMDLGFVTLREAATGEEYAYRLVFPADADVSRGRLSVLTPLGAALLGRRSGESFVYESPGGPIEVAVVRVESGPEAEDDYAR